MPFSFVPAMSRSVPASLSSLSGLALLLALAACGGGGGGSDSASTDGGSSTVTEATLSGVAAVGAPLGGAQISVIDAKGQSLGQATAHPVEGSYSLKISGSFTAPLMVQARGVDAAGQPQLLHSSVLSAAAAMTAHITPLTQAAVALALGTDPAPVFAKGSESASTLASLAQSTAAADFLKTLVKSQLTDLKITDPTTLNLFADSGFAANKGAHDLLLESLRVNLAKSAAGVEQLQLANKLLAGQAQELLIELPTAKTELAKTTGAAPATAITSTLKTTTSATGVLPNLGSLDELGAALNKLIAQGASAATLTASAGLVGYDKHNGRSAADLGSLLAGYAGKNWQLGRFWITGCADDTVSNGNCSRVLVAAPVSDSSGTVVDLFADAVTFNKTTTTAGALKWTLAGNGKRAEFQAHPLAWLALDATGTAVTGLSAGNPSQGVQLLVQGQTAAGAPLLDKATVQTPGGFSIPLAYCQQRWLCLSSAGATSTASTGPLADTLLQPASVGWLGGADTLRNAKFQASYAVGSSSELRLGWLRAALATSTPAQARFPVLDGVSSSAPLSLSSLNAGATLSWASWAKANPDLRLSLVRAVALGSGSSQVQDRSPALAVSTSSLALPAGLFSASGFSPSGYELWLRAVDGSGRIYDTRYSVQP